MPGLHISRELYHSKLAIFERLRGCCCIMWGIDEKAMPTDNPKNNIAGVVELVDTGDLKSPGRKKP